MKFISTIFSLFIFTMIVQGQSFILMNGTAHIGDGKVIDNSFIIVENGKIAGVGDATIAKIDAQGKPVIDVAGKHIYPGLIAPNTTLGLQEIGAVRPTRDNRETGELNPNVRSLIAYNTDSKVVPTVRSNGILLAQVAPQGGLISGSSSVMKLTGWNWEDAVYQADDAIFLNWPAMYQMSGWWGEPGPIKANEAYQPNVKTIKDWFAEAKAYQNSNQEIKNLKFESVNGVFKGTQNLFVRVSDAKEILDVINFSEDFDIQVTLVGAVESWRVADVLAEKKIPVVLGPVHQLPMMASDDIDQPFKTPKILHDAGVLFCLSIGGFWTERNLMFHAGTAAAHGLPKEAAVAAITGNTAKILGLDARTGTLKSGLDANIIVSEGDLLDVRTSIITKAWINGEAVDLGDKQKALYEQYKERYKIK